MRRASPIVLALAAAILIIVACQPSDTTAPTVSIVYPSNGASLAKDTIRIKALATDNVGVSKVEFRVDGGLLSSPTSSKADTFSYLWDATSAATGGHGITATAYDAAANNAKDTVYVTLTTGGGGGDTSYHHSGEIAASDTWYPRNNPHIIDDDVYTDNNATLVIMPGCIVKFNSGTELYCGYNSPGAIIAIGKADSTILFTSNAPSPAAGDWSRISIYSNAMPTTQFAYCTFEYGGSVGSSDGEIWVAQNKVAKVDHCTIRKSGNYGIAFEDIGSSLASFTNDSITACTSYPVDIYPPNVAILVAGNSLSGNATGYDAIMVEGGTGSNGVVANATWVNLGVPYVLNNDVEVSAASGPLLTIQAGTTIKLTSGTEFYCGYTNPGGIYAVGTASSPITFTSAVATPHAGDWSRIGLYVGTTNTTQFAYCTFDYGGLTGADKGEVFVSGCKFAKIDHCAIEHSGNYGITFEDINSSLASFTSNLVSTCALFPVDIYPPNVAILSTTGTYTGNATGYDGVLVEGGTGTNGVVANATWGALAVPYVLSNDVEVSGASGPCLTIAPDVTIELSNNVELYCGYTDAGAISAVGTASSPIVFTSRLASPSPGSWKDVGFYSGATAQSSMQYCTVQYGGGASNYDGDVYIDNTALPAIQHCTLSNSAGFGIYLDGTNYPDPAQLESNNSFSNDPSGHIRIPPGR